jgi:DedD protein|nr:SPOR domain-containing protein [Nitrosomonas nitrosa]
MVRNISEEEALLRKRARRRLVGAVTLVILSVVFLPMILDSEPKQEQQEIDILIPSEDPVSEASPWMMPSEPFDDDINASGGAEAPVPFSVPEFSQTDDDTAELYGTPRVPIPAAKPQYSKPVHVAKTESPKTESSKTEPAKIELPKAEGAFVIQLGAFADPTKARQQQQNLAASGVDAYIETIKVGGNEMVRVRVGPFPTRKAAEEGYEKLKRMGLSGVVTTR